MSSMIAPPVFNPSMYMHPLQSAHPKYANRAVIYAKELGVPGDFNDIPWVFKDPTSDLNISEIDNDLWARYKGVSANHSKLFMQFTKETQNELLTRFFPIFTHEEALATGQVRFQGGEYIVTMMHAKTALPPRVGRRTAAPLLDTSFVQYNAPIDSRGIGFELPQDFMFTQNGQLTFETQLQRIDACWNINLMYKVVSSIVECGKAKHFSSLKFPMDHKAFVDYIAADQSMKFASAKNGSNLQGLETFCNSQMNQNGVGGQYAFILPPEAHMSTLYNSANREVSRTGQQNVDTLATTNFNDGALSPTFKRPVVYVHNLEFTPEFRNPFQHFLHVCEMYQMNVPDEFLTKDYNSNVVSTRINDADNKQKSIIRMQPVFDNCGIFSSNMDDDGPTVYGVAILQSIINWGNRTKKSTVNELTLLQLFKSSRKFNKLLNILRKRRQCIEDLCTIAAQSESVSLHEDERFPYHLRNLSALEARQQFHADNVDNLVTSALRSKIATMLNRHSGSDEYTIANIALELLDAELERKRADKDEDVQLTESERNAVVKSIYDAFVYEIMVGDNATIAIYKEFMNRDRTTYGAQYKAAAEALREGELARERPTKRLRTEEVVLSDATLIQLLHWVPLTRTVFQKLIDHDVPIGFRFQFRRTGVFQAQGMIACPLKQHAKDVSNGMLVIRKTEVKYTESNTIDTITVQTNMESAAVVYSDAIIWIPAAFPSRYVQGMGVEIINPSDDEELSTWGNDAYFNKSIIVMAVPLAWQPRYVFQSLTGKMPTQLYNYSGSGDQELDYPTADEYNAIYNFEQHSENARGGLVNDTIYETHDPRMQVVSLQGYQEEPSDFTGLRFENVRVGQTCLGPHVKPETFEALSGFSTHGTGTGLMTSAASSALY